jgi:hypothetical protein
MQTRTLIILGALLVVLMGGAGFGLAYGVSHMNSGSATVTPTPTTAATAGTTTTKVKNKKYSGDIQALGNNSFVLLSKGKKAKPITIMVDNQTVYNGPGGKISFSSLTVGESVEVKGSLDSQNQTVTAKSVTVLSSGNVTPTP